MTKKLKPFQKIVLGAVSVFIFIIGIAIALYSCSSFDLSIGGSENIKILNELNAEWVLDEQYNIEKLSIDGIDFEWLHKKDDIPQTAILQLHGGAYIRPLNYRENLYQRMAEQYAKVSGAGVLTVDYRVAPDNPYPSALEDALSGYNYLLESGYRGQDIIIAGDSAGGGLTLALTLYLRDNQMEMPCALITMSAWTDLNYRRKPAYVGNNDAKNPYISPIYGDFNGFPPMLMQVGTKDIKNDTISLAEKAKDSGVKITQTTYQNMPHVFQALFPRVSEANQAWSEIELFIEEF